MQTTTGTPVTEVIDKRFIPIPGTLNFRDFGGYHTSDGNRVRRGLLFRCGALNHVPDDAYPQFADLDIGVICDLRRDEELELNPTPEHKPFDCQVRIPIDPGSSIHLRQSFENPDHTYEDRILFMKEITREIARDHVEEYTRLFDELLNVNNGFLLHCTAGKDRTGFGAAMILFALGVSEKDIFDDYLLTNSATDLIERMRPMFNDRYEGRVDEKTLMVTSGVRKEYLRAAIDELIAVHGSINGYLEAVGIDDKARNELKIRLTEIPQN
jgi:protein-tyrosine phosphatase